MRPTSVDLLKTMDDKKPHTRDALMAATGQSSNTVRGRLSELTTAGYVRRNIAQGRTYTITGNGLLALYDATHKRP